VQQLNYTVSQRARLWDLDDSYEGYDWIDHHDADNSVVSFLRRSKEGDIIVFVINATPQVLHGYRLGVPEGGFYREIINTDAETYGGSNIGNMGGLQADDFAWQARTHSLMIEVPPLATVAFKLERPVAIETSTSEAPEADEAGA
jgi:1,4-alpha-glucan branching enzyme